MLEKQAKQVIFKLKQGLWEFNRLLEPDFN